MRETRTPVAAQNLWLGAGFMVLAGISFAVTNVILQKLTMTMGVNSTTAAFYQYFIASFFSIPLILSVGLSNLGTAFLPRHLIRIAMGVIGIQFWVAGLARVEIWQAIALVMLSPFFVTIGAALFLREKVSLARWIATLVGFVGGAIILEPWSSSFTPFAFLPVLAALFWAGSSVLMKTLTNVEEADKITVYLLVLMTPINAAFAFSGGGFSLPSSELVWPLIILTGCATAIANFCLTRAYATADASFVQPFDHLKLPLNVVAGWLVFQFMPSGNLWLGAALIIGASLFIVNHENKRRDDIG